MKYILYTSLYSYLLVGGYISQHNQYIHGIQCWTRMVIL
nr:MAG TPA: hypothetical protein [Caudoviricetes sp.]